MTTLRKSISSTICIILIAELSLGSTIAATYEIHKPDQTSQSGEERALQKEIGSLLIDPSIAALDTPHPDDDGFKLHLSPQDPIVDRNPFFLESQSWQVDQSPSNPRSTGFIENTSELTIQIADLSKSWHLREPLRPLLLTDEYIYLAARDPSFFTSKDNGQGVFVVPYQKLLASSVTGARVPVFFIPLPGDGWTGDVGASELSQQDVVVFRNSNGVQLPVSMQDVRQIVKIETVNLLFATSQAMHAAYAKLQSHPGDADRLRKSMIESLQNQIKQIGSEDQHKQAFLEHVTDLTSTIQSILGSHELSLIKGSTAGFGLLYTGFDLDHPENGSVVFGQPELQVSWLKKIIESIGPKKAYALDPEVSKFLDHSIRVLTVCGVVFVGGVVARYTVLKEKIEQRIAEGKANGDPKVARRVFWDIFAHSITAVAQTPYVWSAQILRYVLDRTRVSENGAVRKLFNATFGFSLKTNNKTPVSQKTLVQGVVVLGGTDSALVAFQGYLLMGWIADGLAWVFPSLLPRVNAAYHSNDPSVSLYLLLAVLQNAIGWISQGSSQYARDIQTNKTQEAERKVADVMRSEGKDPTHEKYKAEFESRVETYVGEALAKQGLPGKKDFLFDANTLYRNVIALIGYQGPKARDLNPDAILYEDNEVDYLALDRPGLTIGALKQSIQKAKNEVKADQASTTKIEALRLLQNILSDFSFLRGFINNPSKYFSYSGLLEVAKRLKNVRGELTLLTEMSSNSSPPRSWVEQSPEGATLAAKYFRDEYFKRFKVEEKSKPNKNPVVVDRGYFENWQIRRAITRAKEKYIRLTGETPDEVIAETSEKPPSDHKILWDQTLQFELIKAMGLHPDENESAFLETVNLEVQSKFDQRLTSDSDFKTNLESLSPGDRDLATALQKSELFSEVYVDYTVNKEAVSPLSPMQPGVFQKFRQTQLKNSSVRTQLARAWEGMYSNTRYKLGLWSKVLRNIPFLDDIIQGNLITFRNIPVDATAAYWWTWALWDAAFPPMTFFISRVLLAGTTIRAGWIMTQRMTGNLGIKPGGSTLGMVKYGVIGGFATMGGFFFYPMFQKDIVSGIEAIGSFCNQLLFGH